MLVMVTEVIIRMVDVQKYMALVMMPIKIDAVTTTTGKETCRLSLDVTTVANKATTPVTVSSQEGVRIIPVITVVHVTILPS